MVEIGTFRGGSARIMSESTRSTVHTIDVFPNADEALLGPDSKVKRFIGDAQAFADGEYLSCFIPENLAATQP